MRRKHALGLLPAVGETVDVHPPRRLPLDRRRVRHAIAKLLAAAAFASAGVSATPLLAAASAQPAISRSLAAALVRVHSINCTPPATTETTNLLPVGVVRSGTARFILIGVCIESQGPFTFALDTGAPESVIDRSLAGRLHLSNVGRAVRSGVIGCAAAREQPVAVTNWSAVGLILTPQSLVSGPLGGLAPGVGLSGLLGSDLLQRFGAVRIDYAHQTLAVERAESPPPTDALLIGPVGAPSAFDVAGIPDTDVAIDVARESGRVVALAPVRIKRHLYQFIVDTGAALLAVSPHTASAAHLLRSSSEQLTAVNCHQVVPIFVGGDGWRLGTIALVRQVILGEPGLAANAPPGLLGSPVLSHYGAAVVDYENARLLLGAPVS